MRSYRHWPLGLVLLALSTCLSDPARASVLTVGIATDNPAALPGAFDAVTAAGHTPAFIGSLGDPLTGYDVVWVLSTENGPPVIIAGFEANVANYVFQGGVLSFHDRNVNQGQSAADYIPGAGGVTFVSNFSDDIDVVTAGTLVTNGPGGLIDDTTLDGGNFSNHGYAEVASLPAGSTVIFSDGDPTRAVDFTYALGSGAVYYSSIPLDRFLESGPSAFSTVYATNEVAFQADLSPANAVVPEPASLAIWSIASLMGLVQLRQRRRRKTAS